MSPRPPGERGARSPAAHDARRRLLEVRALGPTRVRCNAVDVDTWVSRRGLDILRYLVVSRRPARREVLMELFWPRTTPRSARNNLNVAISGLRRSLEAAAPGTYVIHREGNYSFDASLEVWTDIDAFEDSRRAGSLSERHAEGAAARAHYERAASLYRGALFEDSDEEWLLPDRRLFEERFIAMQERLATHYLADGEDERAVDIGHSMLRAEPCRESAHQLLMRAYGSQGQYHLAARQYAECVTALEREFGIAPHPETTEVFRDLLGSHAPARGWSPPKHLHFRA